MFNTALVTFKGIFRDRTFYGIALVALLFVSIPLIASFSMRQVQELSVNLSLSLISFILLMLAFFLGGVSLWKDIDRRHIYTVLGLPLSRSSYLLGKFCGVALFMLLVAGFLGLVATVAVALSVGGVPPLRPLDWSVFTLAVGFDLLKYLLLVAIAFLLSTASTSFFLPIFGTISIFLVGSSSQEAYDFIQTEAGSQLPWLVKQAAVGLYYLLPNFAAFDLKLNAVYGVAIDGAGLALTLLYFLVYSALVLAAATFVFDRRELK
jgi:Cu-processing system permease protein